MKVYLDFEDMKEKAYLTDNALISIQRKDHYIDKVEFVKIKSLTDYTKQVRKEVCEEITEELLDISHEYWKTFLKNGVQYMTSNDLYELLKEITKQIQGETK